MGPEVRVVALWASEDCGEGHTGHLLRIWALAEWTDGMGVSMGSVLGFRSQKAAEGLCPG